MCVIRNVDSFAEETQVKIVCRGTGEMTFTEQNVNRPGLQLAGFFEHFKENRLQIFGKSEVEYLFSLDNEKQIEALERLMSYPLPGIVICRSMPVHAHMLSLAKEKKIPIFTTSEGTSDYIARTKTYLSYLLAPHETIPGVLVDVLGIGMLLIGDSGMGKSETALELVRHGHKLVADDAVEIMRLGEDRLVGSAPETIRFLMEIRGLGIIDVRQMFGVGAVLLHKTIGAVVHLMPWDEVRHTAYDRLELQKHYIDLLGVKVREITIPVAPGRNLASVIELAAQNLRLDAIGYNITEELDARLEFNRKRK